MKTLKTLFAFVAGAATGAAVALVLAPETGEETRKRLKTVSDEAIDKIKATLEEHGISVSDEAAEDIAAELASEDTFGSE